MDRPRLAPSLIVIVVFLAASWVTGLDPLAADSAPDLVGVLVLAILIGLAVGGLSRLLARPLVAAAEKEASGGAPPVESAG